MMKVVLILRLVRRALVAVGVDNREPHVSLQLLEQLQDYKGDHNHCLWNKT